MGEKFHKYERRGAYHWDFISDHPFLHHCPTTARYKAVLTALPGWRDLKVADVGCGDGALTGLLVQEGAQVTGVEPESDGRRLAKDEFERRGLAGTFVANTVDLADGGFDVVVCSDVIEHVTDPRGLLQELHRLLKPGGAVVVSTPIRLTDDPLDMHHIQEFFPREFKSLMDEVFEDVHLKKHIPMPGLMLYYWRPWFFLRRPLITWVCNLLDIVLGVNPVERINALDRYHQLQVATALKSRS